MLPWRAFYVQAAGAATQIVAQNVAQNLRIWPPRPGIHPGAIVCSAFLYTLKNSVKIFIFSPFSIRLKPLLIISS